MASSKLELVKRSTRRGRKRKNGFLRGNQGDAVESDRLRAYTFSAERPQVEVIGPNKDFIEIVRMVLAQNEIILAINRDLLTKLSNPMLSIAHFTSPEVNPTKREEST